MLIKVTHKHMCRGIRFEPSYCPVALAIKDAICDGGVEVSNSYIKIYNYKKHLTDIYPTPEIASKFINAYDGNSEGYSLHPFEFELYRGTIMDRIRKIVKQFFEALHAYSDLTNSSNPTQL